MTTHPPPTARRNRLFPQLLLVGALVIAGVAVYRLFPGAPAKSSDLRRITIVPPFALTERSGRTVTNNDLYGKVWIADFVYTTCPGPCPIVSASMAQLQQALARDPQVQLVTFTVDPVTDTPAVLAAYADHFGASKDRWWFLTGSEKQMYDAIHNGFLMAMQDNSGQPPVPGQYKVTHSTELALIDAGGVVRGYYEGTTPEGRRAVLLAVSELEKE